MKKLMIKNTKLIKMAAVALFAFLMAFNVTMVIHDNNAAGIDLSFSGLKAMAFNINEDCNCGTAPECSWGGCGSASGFYNCLDGACTSDCPSSSCSLTCTNQVGPLWIQTIGDCGVDYR